MMELFQTRSWLIRMCNFGEKALCHEKNERKKGGIVETEWKGLLDQQRITGREK